jgi:hypothetical protein
MGCACVAVALVLEAKARVRRTARRTIAFTITSHRQHRGNHMAKAAKQVDVEITPKLVNGVINDVFEAVENIETARGKFMNEARRHRDTIAAVYERAAAQGIPQKVMKLQVKIETLQGKLTGAITELEAEHRKLLQKVVKARGNKAQLTLFNDLPAIKEMKIKAPPKEKAAKAKPATVEEAVSSVADESNVHHLGAA